MSNSMPYVKWHGRDWLGDPLLRMVGVDVRGVWMDLLCSMMEADPYGHLAVNGKPMTDEQAARLIGLDIGTFKGYLKTIEDAGISSRTESGMLYSRRLVRDHAVFLSASASGRKGGGNPALRMKKNLEARSQKPEAKAGLEDGIKAPIKGKGIPESIEIAKAYGKTIGLPDAQTEAFFDHFTANGWRVGGKSLMKDWKAAMRTWKRNNSPGGQFFKPDTPSNRTPVQPITDHSKGF